MQALSLYLNRFKGFGDYSCKHVCRQQWCFIANNNLSLVSKKCCSSNCLELLEVNLFMREL